MAVRVRFRCERCGGLPDAATQRALEGQLRDRSCGEFRDAQPGGWLVWTGGGALGSKLYACAEHRAELAADVRRRFGAIRSVVWRDEPYPAMWPDGLRGFDDRERRRCSRPSGGSSRASTGLTSAGTSP